MTENKHRHIGQLSLERFVLGELNDLERDAVLRSMEECEECAAAVASTREDEKAFALKPIPGQMRDLWLKEEKPGALGKILAILVPVAAAAAVALVVVLGRGPVDEVASPGEGEVEDVIRIKGGGEDVRELDLGFYLRDGKQNLIGSPGQKLKQGDRIQFWYRVPEEMKGFLVGIDGRGVVSTYGTETGDLTGILKTGKGRVFGSSLVLDDASGVERFFLCAGMDDGHGVETVRRAAEQLVKDGANLSEVERLPLECEQASVWIQKE